MAGTLRWNGNAFKSRAARASVGAIDETLDAAARQAANAWPRETGLSAESFEVLEPAHSTMGGASGVWGASRLPAGDYSESSRDRVLLVEFGFRGRAGVGIIRRTGDEQAGQLRGRVARGFR